MLVDMKIYRQGLLESWLGDKSTESLPSLVSRLRLAAEVESLSSPDHIAVFADGLERRNDLHYY